ncbi:unnamed protein product [Adineta steineri]|uniref:Glycosyl hydrolase family 13 catalytic domain-containing protein n=1 Tax=Adineta steineri TaxID=433720 RepID=A0A815A4Q2_9BILA|nr:unnamed protein product [Adineta steineri]
MIQPITKTKLSYKLLLPLLSNHIITRYSSQLSKSNEQTKFFSLFAPTVAELNSVSSFSHWKPIQMEKNLNTDIFPILLAIKIPDSEHEYNYCVQEKRHYLSNLGINAIELMRIQDHMGNEHNWGYSPTHHFALKATYETRHDLKKFVDECHRRGIDVLLDGVFNHSSVAYSLVLIGPEFNYDYYDGKLKLRPSIKYAQDIVRYSAEEFHLDGIRFDPILLDNKKQFQLDSLKYIISTKSLVKHLACHDNERLIYLIDHFLSKTFNNDASQRVRLRRIIHVT